MPLAGATAAERKRVAAARAKAAERRRKREEAERRRREQIRKANEERIRQAERSVRRPRDQGRVTGEPRAGGRVEYGTPGRPGLQADWDAAASYLGWNEPGTAPWEIGTRALAGPSAASWIPGGQPQQGSPWQVLGEGAMAVAPVGWLARGATKGIGRAIRPAARLMGGRDEIYRGLAAQFPSSPSSITAPLQRVRSAASGKLGGAVDVLRESDSPLARGAGKALTPVSARGRVPRQAGRIAKKEAGRTRAFRSPEINIIRRVRGKDRAAQFWYAQLPPEYRNARGLTLVRDKYVANLERLRSGRLEQDIIEDIQKALAADDAWNVDRLRMRLTGLKDERKDLIVAIRRMDELIRAAPEADDRVVDATRALMGDREEILRAAGKLSDESVADRPGAVMDWLGRDNLSDASSFDDLPYVGHRPGRVARQRSTLTPGGWSTSKSKVPEGVGRRNDLILVNTGRVRPDIRVVLEDWQAAQVYDFANNAKADLLQAGEPVMGALKPNHVLINPRGHRIPRHWRQNLAETLTEQGFDPKIAEEAEEAARVIDNTFATESDVVDEILRDAYENGYAQELRQVPTDVAKRYFAQIVGPKAITALGQSAGRAVGQAGDLVNDIVYASLIYSNPGYVPANFAGNAIFAGLQQGPLLPLNFLTAGQLLARAPKRLRAQIINEVGQGATAAVASGGISAASQAFKKGARVLGHVADTPLRVTAFVHEMRRAGVIGWKPWLDAGDFQKVEAFLNSPQARRILNDASWAGNEAMVSFERLGPWERALAKRALFVWPWIRGATAYPFRFAMDHPIRSAALAYGAAGGPLPERLDDIRENVKSRVVEDVPRYLDPAFYVDETEIGGVSYPRILAGGPISPIDTAAGAIGSALGKRGERNIWEYTNPLIRSAVQVAQKETPWGREADSYREAARLAGEGLAPQFGLAKDLISPPSAEDAGLYPGDVTRLGRLARASRVIPYPIDPKEALAAARREGTAPPKRESVRATDIRSRIDKETLAQERAEGRPLTRNEELTGEESARERDVQWAYDNPDLVPKTMLPILEDWRDMDIQIRAQLRRISAERAEKSDEVYIDLGNVEPKVEYAIKLAVLKQFRPDVVTARAEENFRKYFEESQELQDLLKDWINERLEYKDILGHTISSLIDNTKEAALAQATG